MPERKRITHQFLDAVNIADSRVERVLIPALMLLGILYAGLQVLERDWVELAFFVPGVALLFALALLQPLQTRLLRQRLNRRHATYIALFWAYSIAWLNLARALSLAQPTGKTSGGYYTLLLLLIMLAVMMLRSLVMLTPFGYRVFISQIPLWEQVLVAINEVIAAGLLASFVGASVLPVLLQPRVFTLRVDTAYTVGLTLVLGVYYVGMQVMWVQRWNDWLSQNHIWVRLARVLSPLALVATSLVIARRLAERAEPRSADLLGNSAADLAFLSIGGVIWLVIVIVLILVYTGGRGLRQRFLPDLLLDLLPARVSRWLRSISDMDMMLMIGLLATVMPVYLFLLGEPGGVLGALSGQILQRGSALIETTEQALALLFSLPFYLLAVVLLLLYAYAFSRPAVSAEQREKLLATLPVSFLIVLIITLYLFAIPFSQVLTEGRLPQLPQDLGRILAFNVLMPLVLLYLHYFLLVRVPYGRGQSLWRDGQTTRLEREQTDTDARIETLNHEIEVLDQVWHGQDSVESARRFETLFRYIQLNSLRDDLNMQRLQIVTARQQIAEVSETPVSLAVARLPLRIVSLGIPLLIMIQLYQWAVVNNGLREIINTPNLTVDQFFRIILQQANF